MIKQYPYTLKALINTEATYDEATGDWIPGTSTWSAIGDCRDEINGGGQKIITEDGQSYVFSAVIYCPKGISQLPKGTKVEVWNKDVKRLQGEVVRFGDDQLHTRIWL